MKTISLCMIVKNEEAVLGRALSSAQEIADEIIVVDTGSTDHTWEIAGNITDRRYRFPWTDDFSEARNYSFSKATMDYQMWLDADDVILPEACRKLLVWKETSDRPDVVMLPYHTAFDAEGHPTYSYYRERLIRREAGFRWEGAIHEVITTAGDIRYLDAAITHRKEQPSDPDRNLRIFQKLLASGKSFSPREQFYYARELYYHQEYRKAIQAFSDFVRRPDAWLENRIDACRHLAYCYDALGEHDDAFSSLLRTLEYDTPRAEICCDLGERFLQLKRYPLAIFWYQLAASLPRNDQGGGFVSPDCYDFIPYLQLCVCFDRMGERERALHYHEKAAACKPSDPAVLYNQKYFENAE